VPRELPTGIIGCGVYIPRLRIKREEYQKAWGYFAPRWIEEKSVAEFDEDAITMGVEAASNALRNTKLEASHIDALYFASTSPPYAEKQNASTIATALGCRSDIGTLDAMSSTKCGLSALLSGLDYVTSGRGKVSMIIASDSPLGSPIGPLEHQFGAAAAAVILGRDPVNGLIEASFSVISESLGERFRRHGEAFVTTVDLGRFHEESSNEVILSCVRGLMQKLGQSPKNYDFFAIQGTDPIRSVELGKKLGFEESKTAPNMLTAKLGDLGAASSLLVLSKLLESSSFKQRVLLCSYGAGAGADAISVVVDAEMKPVAGLGFDDYLERKEYADYSTYLKLRGFLKEHDRRA
jgi:hydroxymethylglutaryl-CoA synthase